MPLLPIPLTWKPEVCVACGDPVRRMTLGRHDVMLDPAPVSVLAERLATTGAVIAYEHRVGYQPHRCARIVKASGSPAPSSRGDSALPA
jgi:hypothetical protein